MSTCMQVLLDQHAEGCSVGGPHPEAIAILPAAHTALCSFDMIKHCGRQTSFLHAVACETHFQM